MIDLSNLPNNTRVDSFMQPTSGNEVHTWTKPVGCNFVYMIAIGGGGGGGAGITNPTTYIRPGGGGGASGCMTILSVPAFLIPDTLFIRVGAGGGGDIPYGTGGGAGTSTIISAYRISSVTEYLLYADGGNGGGSATTANVPGAGGTSTTPLISNNTLGTIGKWRGFASEAGITGSPYNNSPGNPFTFNFYLSGGAGGGGVGTSDVAGGDILSSYGQPTSKIVVPGGPGVLNGTVGQTSGGSGFFIPKRFASYGGAGGAGGGDGAGGNGGNGGLGSGGGGGGGGNNGTGGSNGGKGGDGFVIIISS